MLANCLTRHHRRPKCQDGSNKAYNISLVREMDHRNWHVLCCGTLSPDGIAQVFNRPERFRPRQQRAWDELFGRRTKRQIAAYVTEVYLDPSFTLFYGNAFFARRN